MAEHRITARLFQAITTTAAFRRVGPTVVPRLDRWLHRVSGGRRMLGGSAVPSLMLTATGARSGEARRVPLACWPRPDGSLVVVGSNFGREHHPAWTANLLAHPDASVSYEGREVRVRATMLDGAAREAVWPGLIEIWPTYDRYTEISGRELRVFELTPVEGS